MRFYNGQHRFHRGIDPHARTMFGVILNQSGHVLLECYAEPSRRVFLARPRFRPRGCGLGGGAHLLGMAAFLGGGMNPLAQEYPAVMRSRRDRLRRRLYVVGQRADLLSHILNPMVRMSRADSSRQSACRTTCATPTTGD